jgi:hypothetical protein
VVVEGWNRLAVSVVTQPVRTFGDAQPRDPDAWLDKILPPGGDAS